MAKVNVALIGQGFMGRTHSNAWGQVTKFFKPPLQAVMHTVFGQKEENPAAFADNWGWQHASTDWEAVVRSPEIGLVDVVTPNYMHAPVAQAAIAAGKPCACEKPIAGSLADARDMVEAARRPARSRRSSGSTTAAARPSAWPTGWSRQGSSAKSATCGPTYLQDWAGEAVPLLWRFDKKLAGSGAHGDLNAHIIDMTRFVTGQEITEVAGAIAETFIKERTLPTGVAAGGIAAGRQGAAARAR